MMSTTLTHLAFAASLLSSVALAAPTAAAAACKPLKTQQATFDTLPANVAPPNGYAGNNWPTWIVFDSLAGTGVKNPSGNHTIQAGLDSEGASFYTNEGVLFQLNSFYFGCTAPYPDGSGTQVAAGCDIMIVSRSETPLDQVTSFGPFTYNVNYTQLGNGVDQKMQKVTVDAQGSQLYFFITNGASGATLYLDSLVIEQMNSNCS